MGLVHDATGWPAGGRHHAVAKDLLTDLSREERADVVDGVHVTEEADLPATSPYSRKPLQFSFLVNETSGWTLTYLRVVLISMLSYQFKNKHIC